MARGELTLDGAQRAAAACAPDVVEHVLYDNYLQAQILSQEVDVSRQRIEAYEDLMQQLEAEGELEREVEFLPSSEEMLERRADGRGWRGRSWPCCSRTRNARSRPSCSGRDLPDSEYLERDLRATSRPRSSSGSAI